MYDFLLIIKVILDVSTFKITNNNFFLFFFLLAFQDVDAFVCSSEEIWRNVAFHHLLTNGSSAVNGCRQNESPKIKTDKNITIIHK